MAAHYRMVYSFNAPIELLRAAAHNALQQFPAGTPFWSPDGRRVCGSVSLSFWSWGEDITIDVDPGVICVDSKSSFALTLVDWGRNRKNVEKLFALINQYVAYYSQPQPAPMAQPPM